MQCLRCKIGNYIGISTSRVSDFYLGHVFVLFLRLTQQRLAEATAINLKFDAGHFHGLRRQSARVTVTQRSDSWLERMVLMYRAEILLAIYSANCVGS